MSSHSRYTVAIKKIVPVLLLCAGTLASSGAHANWFTRWLCSGDNYPKQCMDHFSIALKEMPMPPYSEQAAQAMTEASKLQGEKKIAFIEKNRQVLGIPAGIPLNQPIVGMKK